MQKFNTQARPSATATVGAFHKLGNGLAKVLMTVVHKGDSHKNPETMREVIAATFGQKMEAVASTFRTVDAGPLSTSVVGIVRVRTEAVAFDESVSSEDFRCVSSNIFIDNEEQMWSLRAGTNGKMLVKNTGIGDDESLHELLTAKCSAYQGGAADMVAHCSVEPQAGQLFTFISASGELSFGYVIASTDIDSVPVATLDNPEAVPVLKSAMIDLINDQNIEQPALSTEEQINITVSTSRGVVDVNQIVAYYKRVYGHNANFFKELESRIRSHSFC